MADARAALKAAQDALEGVTGGASTTNKDTPWHLTRTKRFVGRVIGAPYVCTVNHEDFPAHEFEANARFIAASRQLVPALSAHLEAALAEVERLREGLEQLAAFTDTQASFHLACTGSFGLFDEPGAVEIARALLGDTHDNG